MLFSLSALFFGLSFCFGTWFVWGLNSDESLRSGWWYFILSCMMKVGVTFQFVMVVFAYQIGHWIWWESRFWKLADSPSLYLVFSSLFQSSPSKLVPFDKPRCFMLQMSTRIRKCFDFYFSQHFCPALSDRKSWLPSLSSSLVELSEICVDVRVGLPESSLGYITSDLIWTVSICDGVIIGEQ